MAEKSKEFEKNKKAKDINDHEKSDDDYVESLNEKQITSGDTDHSLKKVEDKASSKVNAKKDEPKEASENKKSNITNINEKKAFKASYQLQSTKGDEEELVQMDDELISSLKIGNKDKDVGNENSEKLTDRNWKSDKKELKTNFENIGNRNFIESVKKHNNNEDEFANKTFRKVEVKSDSEEMIKNDVNSDSELEQEVDFKENASKEVSVNQPTKRISKQLFPQKKSSDIKTDNNKFEEKDNNINY